MAKGQKRRNPGREESAEPWYLATNLGDAESAASWYRQRGWIEQSFKDSKSRFGLARVQVRSPKNAPAPFAGGPHHRFGVADADGAAGDRGHAQALARGDRSAWKSQRRKPGAGSVRSPWGPAAGLLTEVVPKVVGMRQALVSICHLQAS